MIRKAVIFCGGKATRFNHGKPGPLKPLIKVNNRQITVVDIGCGTCKLFQVLIENSLSINYIGIEPRGDFVETSIKRYSK